MSYFKISYESDTVEGLKTLQCLCSGQRGGGTADAAMAAPPPVGDADMLNADPGGGFSFGSGSTGSDESGFPPPPAPEGGGSEAPRGSDQPSASGSSGTEAQGAFFPPPPAPESSGGSPQGSDESDTFPPPPITSEADQDTGDAGTGSSGGTDSNPPPTPGTSGESGHSEGPIPPPAGGPASGDEPKQSGQKGRNR